VPATGSTRERWWPTSLFSRLDLPTLGAAEQGHPARPALGVDVPRRLRQRVEYQVEQVTAAPARAAR